MVPGCTVVGVKVGNGTVTPPTGRQTGSVANRSTRPSRWPVPSWWPAARACPDLVACGLPGPVRVVVGKSNPDKTGQAVLGYPVHRASLCRPGGLVLGLR